MNIDILHTGEAPSGEHLRGKGRHCCNCK